MGHIPDAWLPPQWMHLFLVLENLWSTDVCFAFGGVWDVSFLFLFSGHFMGKWPLCLHLEQYGGLGQLWFKCPVSLQFQHIGPDFPIDVEVEDDDDEVCLMPFLLAVNTLCCLVPVESIIQTQQPC